MPRVIHVAQPTPVTVEAAAVAFGSSLRMHLIRHYRTHPGSQVDAAAALGVHIKTIANNAKQLIEVGVLIQEAAAEDGRAYVYRVDEDRVQELLNAVRAFTSQ